LQPLLSVKDLVKHYVIGEASALDKLFGRPRKAVHALDGVSFDVPQNETLGVVGESGCGKTTLLRIIAGLEKASEGEVLLDGKGMVQGS
jgi:peptide/nickel transport system ATP-binding protein